MEIILLSLFIGIIIGMVARMAWKYFDMILRELDALRIEVKKLKEMRHE